MKGEYISIETARIMADIEKENKELQDRINKAIEYIEDNTHCFSTDTKEIYFSIETETDEEFFNTLENILKGEDKDE